MRLLAVMVVLGSLLLPAPAHATTAPPPTIPALRSWTSGTGSFTLAADSRIVVEPRQIWLLGRTGQTFADDLSRLTGLPIRLAIWPPARRGDIQLTLGGSHTAEGYLLNVGLTLQVEGSADAGVFYGTRTLLQWFRQDRTVPGGVAHDWPTKSERGLMVDVGRKFFDIEWLRARVRELAYAKMNYLHLHLSDNLGFRLESASHPEVVSEQHYTKEQIASLISYAARYHVQIVPEIDAPGHMDQVLHAHPSLKLVRDDGFVHNGFIDLSKPEAYTLIEDLVTEYLPLFRSGYWHIGADEYVSGGSGAGTYDRYPQLLAYAREHYGPNATAKDVFYGYVNWLNDIVRRHGKTTRMWNDDIRVDGSTVRPNSNIIVEHWYNRAKPPALTPQQLVDAGHSIINGHYTQTYYVLGSSRKPNLTSMYESWHPDVFHNGLKLASGAANRGAKVHVWCDRPAAETQEQVATNIRSPLRVLAQHTWDSPKPVATWASFLPMITSIGDAP